MANGSNAVTGNSVFGFKSYGSRIISTIFSACPTLAIFGFRNNNKPNTYWDPGNPTAGMLISGAELPPAMKKQIQQVQRWQPLFEYIRQDDVQVQGYRPNSPTIAVGSGGALSVTVTDGVITDVSVTNGGSGYAGAPPTIVLVDSLNRGQGAVVEVSVTNGQISSPVIRSGGYGYTSVTALVVTGNTDGQKNIRPAFGWARRSSPMYVYQDDIDSLEALSNGNKDVFANHRLDLQAAALQRHTASLIQKVQTDILHGPGPTDTSEFIWDNPYSIAQAIDYNNTYADIDRSLAANYAYRGVKITDALNLTLEGLFQEVMFNLGKAAIGTGCNVALVGPQLFVKFQQESQAYTSNANTDVNVMAVERQFGFKMQVIKYNTMYVVCDNNIQPGRCYCINTGTWFFATKDSENFKMQPWTNQATVEGGKAAWYSTLSLQYMFGCFAPQDGNVQFTNLT